MRPRLIRPMVVGVRRYDVEATRAVGGLDADFGSVVVQTAGDGERVYGRREFPEVKLRAQIEDQTWQALRMFGAGNSPDVKMTLTFDYRDLEEHKLVSEETGELLLRVNDRLETIYTADGMRVLQRIPTPPGLYAIEVRPAAISLSGQPGLVVMRLSDRALSEAPG